MLSQSPPFILPYLTFYIQKSSGFVTCCHYCLIVLVLHCR